MDGRKLQTQSKEYLQLHYGIIGKPDYEAAKAVYKMKKGRISSIEGFVRKTEMPDGNIMFYFSDFSRIYVKVKSELADCYMPGLSSMRSTRGRFSKITKIPVRL
jgi:hypothetical protein